MQLEVRNKKALANTVMALAANTGAKSPVELSNSPLFHYQNTSVSKSVDGLANGEEEWLEAELDIQHLVNLHLSPQMLEQPVLHLQTDATSVCHPHSPTLEGRTYVYVPNNVVPGNKPVGIGYQVSAIHIAEAQSQWSLPLSMRRIKPEQSATSCAVKQIERLFDPGQGILPLREGQLTLNDADTGYAHPAFIAPLHRHENLVNIVRLRTGSKIWEADRQSNTGGAERIYAETPLYLRAESRQASFCRKGKTWVKLQGALGEQLPDDEQELRTTTRKGRPIILKLQRWNDKMWRSKKGHNMHHKPLDIICVEVRDANTGKPLFKDPLWLGMAGMRKNEVSTELAYQSYRHRYDIEPAFRFEKQRLMLQSYQPLSVGHFDNWLLVALLSFWLLFTASDQVQYLPKKWQQYPLGEAERRREQTKRWSASQTQKSALRLFSTFDPTAFLPKKCKKGKGRQKGDLQPPRPRFKVLKKHPKKKNTLTSNLKKE